MLRLFDIVPEIDLDLMTPDQDLAAMTAAILVGIRDVLRSTRPDLVVVQGDTTSAFAAGLAAFYAGIDVAHVEAGLRSGDSLAPWPEEVNRKLLGVVTRFHFAPTEDARANLLREGTDPTQLFLTGNTVIDALMKTASRIAGDDVLRARIDSEFSFLIAESASFSSQAIGARASARDSSRSVTRLRRSRASTRTSRSSIRCTSIPT